MSVTLSYDATLSRVRISATGMGSTNAALFERSIDQITWTTVRGGVAATVTSGAASLDDYEFHADVVNYYRVTSPKDVAFVNAGTASHGNNTSLTPALPSGHTSGDLLLILAGIHNSGVGSPNTPSSYTLLLNMGNVKVFGKIDGGAESAPSVTFAGGATGPTSAQMAAFRNVGLSASGLVQTFDASSQNISYPALSIPLQRMLVLYVGWKRNNWTSVNTLAGTGGTAAEIGDPTTFQGSIGQGLAWDWLQQITRANIPAGVFTVVGGGVDVCRGAVMSFAPQNLVQSSSITPTLGSVWLKSVSRPFLNTPVTPLRPLPVPETEGRAGVFEIVGRSDPVAVTDLRASKQYVLRLLAETEDERDRIELFLDSGEPIFLHAPAGSPRPGTMHAAVGSTTYNPVTNVYTLPVRRIAAPGPDVVGSTATWQTVINTYATWADVIAAKATWADLLELVGSPSEVIVS